MFRENKEGRVYGLIFIDNKSGAVFNGSDLGKTYSGQALVKRFDNWIAGEKDKQERVCQISDLQISATVHYTQSTGRRICQTIYSTS